MSASIAQDDPDLAALDESTITREHWKILFISGMGFFTDAYDLFIIGVAMHLIRAEWHVSPLAQGLVTSTALLAAAFGALLFGRIADMLGRKRIYGYEVLVLAAGAIASAFSPDIWWLIGFRIVLGIGIGGDYPVSSTIMSEFSGRRHRGMMVSLVFAMQAAGLIVGPLLAALLLASGLHHDLVWRLLLAFGAVPALAVFQMRRHLAETPRFRLAAKKVEVGRASFAEGFRTLLARRDLRLRLLGASLAWFLMDFAYYGNTVSSPMVLHAIAPKASLLDQTLTQLAVFAVAAVPGYFVAAATMDRMGRKSIQILGFAMMGVSFLALALIPGIERLIYPFLIIYGLSYFFTEFGPNATTFVYPAELFPVEGRTTGHGIASATGKIGGFVGVFTFPPLMAWHGLLAAEMGAAIASVIGLAVTVAMLPETKGRSLEELSAPAAAPANFPARRMAAT
ncbi:MAG TPA: MFS transporter [Acetobacteraceae bacterium]|nr:MFS transporter [Acetobacteraceae bacterium]